jgi:hypothetical protein
MKNRENKREREKQLEKESVPAERASLCPAKLWPSEVLIRRANLEGGEEESEHSSVDAHTNGFTQRAVCINNTVVAAAAALLVNKEQ